MCQSTQSDSSSLSHLPTVTATHRERIIFSLYCNASESLNRKCQQGKSTILQLCHHRDSGNCRNSSSLTFSLWLWWQKLSGTLEGGEKTKLDNAQIICPTIVTHSGSLKGTDKTRSTIIGRGLCKSILLLTWGAPPKRFHIPASTHDFWPKKKNLQFQNGMNYRFHSLNSSPLLLSSLLSSTLDTLLLFYSVKEKHGCLLLGQRGMEWPLYVNFIILDHLNPIQVASVGLGQGPYPEEVSTIGNMTHGGNYSSVFEGNP